MAQVLRLLGSRYVLVLLLLLGIGTVIIIGRALGGPGSPTGVTAGVASAAPTVIASGAEDDSVQAPESPPGPSTSPGATPPQTEATRFLTAWLNHTTVTPDAWYAGMKKYMTSNLAGELAGVDPADVPAARMTGPVTLIDQAADLVQASIPVDSGVVTLRLLATNGRWLVDGVDWTRA
ncbi:MAG TPA: hypothetical protein VJT31_01720 [Rugosimonospora sp.]|nr:hypothetical protein [Rugosimonospora sp.]